MKLLLKLAASLSLALPTVLSADHYLDLADFCGNYIGWGYSTGGYSGPCPGTSQANVFQQTVDKYGNGTVNFISYNVFGCVCATPTPPPVVTYCRLPDCSGDDCDTCALPCPPSATTIGTSQTVNPAPPFNFKIQIFDKLKGVATVKVSNFPIPGVVFTQDLVAIVKDDKVQETVATFPTGSIVFGSSTAISNFATFFGNTNVSINYTKRQ